MGACKFCSKQGMFLQVDTMGLCSGCALPVREALQSINRVLQESLALVKASKVLATRLSRCDDIDRCMDQLRDHFEAKGIRLPGFDSNDIRSDMPRVRAELVAAEIDAVVLEARQKATLATTVRQRVSLLQKASMRVQDLSKLLVDPSVAQPTLDALIRAIEAITIAGHVADADKAAFKGQNKKAIDRYQEALYALKTDTIPDDQQLGQIRELEAKVAALQEAAK